MNTQNTKARPLKRDFGDTWTREETLDVLHEALAAPAGEMDVPLIRECVATLEPRYRKTLQTRGEAVWAGIQEAIASPQQQKTTTRTKTRMPRRKFITIVVAAVLALALAAVAVGAAINRGVFNFLNGSGYSRDGEQVQPAAYDLLNSDLAHLSLPHVDIDVREAVYDGHDLRIVYSVWERDRDPNNPLTEDDLYKSIIDAGWEDGATCCDWLEVDGQTVYLNDTYQAFGDRPGEALYYLSSSLPEWGIEEVGETMTIGLPLMQRTDGPGMYVVDEMRFTISSSIPEGMIHKATPVQTQIGDVTFALDTAEFTPVSGFIRISLLGDTTANYDLGNLWGYAKLYDKEGNELGYTSLKMWDFSNQENAISVEYTVTPPAEWPNEMYLALQDREGNMDKECAIPITF